jgi:hypothetical protein
VEHGDKRHFGLLPVASRGEHEGVVEDGGEQWVLEGLGIGKWYGKRLARKDRALLLLVETRGCWGHRNKVSRGGQARWGTLRRSRGGCSLLLLLLLLLTLLLLCNRQVLVECDVDDWTLRAVAGNHGRPPVGVKVGSSVPSVSPLLGPLLLLLLVSVPREGLLWRALGRVVIAPSLRLLLFLIMVVVVLLVDRRTVVEGRGRGWDQLTIPGDQLHEDSVVVLPPLFVLVIVPP